ncbi:MAG: glucosyltransferase domain-containing protein [Eubacterium sp.]|nr:glucosyltransferase domain-containing protein [Eubacterium sp.]MCM1304047.1 glucosyltransferase domain-containing protein [Butyrivibrio sp.]MCM1410614.1 glucosyltransferase domain-containing protein [Lachnospiraceae bacterium]
MTPEELFGNWNRNIIKREWKTAFFSTFCIGLLVHMPVLLSDIPNHDGLASMYFDQNMITSGRWFLMVACGFSSFFTVPWLIGVLGLFFLSLAAAALVEFLEIRRTWAVALTGGLLVSFPALASTFAYVFTMDGYMLALLLAVLAALFTKKYSKGFLAGGVCLAFSMGIYQAYLPFAMILSVYGILMLAAGEESIREKTGKAARYLYMGAIGAALYYLILQILLKIQGKELASYQGIDDMASGRMAGGLFAVIKNMYHDFAAFSLKGNVIFQSIPSAGACLLLLLAALGVCFYRIRSRKGWKNPFFFVIITFVLVIFPMIANVILLISPDVTYHLLMRYQWVLFLIGLLALAGRDHGEAKVPAWAEWAALCAAFVLVFHYAVADNIAYSNLEKRYEKTYAYCVRLLDRIEQTDGYYPGIPIAMIGYVSDEQYPDTDISLRVTSNMIGLNGDSLLYTADNYREFIRHYLGATLNIQPPEAMAEMYYSEEYEAMDSFPGEDSIRIIDGIMYIKTENKER